jgi:hypothetical protein
MLDGVINYLRVKRIDSFQKLRFLLFLHQHPHIKGTIQEFSEALYLGDILLLTGIVRDLQQVGLVACVGNRYSLHNKSEIRSNLQRLAEVFEDPISRQELLNQMGVGVLLLELA